MKLKYKKIILLTTMSTMGIGLLTLSVSNDKSKAEESLSNKTTAEAGLLADDSNAKLQSFSTTSTDEAATSPTLIPTLAPTQAPLPVYDIEEGAYPEIEKLFKEFYSAKTDRDVEVLNTLLSDATKVESQEKLQKKTQYIEEYQNIKTYTKKGAKEGTFIVYVYHEIKFTGINTPAPGLSKFYVVTGEDGKVKIFSGEMDEQTKEYYAERNNDEDVISLIDMTNKRSEKAIAKDEDLQSFWKGLADMAKSSNSEAGSDKTE